mmetsp:Transcript_36829/g.115251  ORF Transcript_36829/g.115251 Transcript_36829/m.115251 type:complete len:455 (+) Transcript_36829:202-1566(+)
MIRRLRKGAKISGKRYAITATIHSLRFSESIPWHSSKVWYHENARECAELDSNFQEVAILWKRKSGKEVMSSWKPCYDVANEKPTQHKLICWDEDISLALMLYPVDLKRMLEKSTTFTLMGRAFLSSNSKAIASAKVDVAKLVNEHDGCATMELELQIEHKPLGRLMLTLLAKPLLEDNLVSPERPFQRCVSSPDHTSTIQTDPIEDSVHSVVSETSESAEEKSPEIPSMSVARRPRKTASFPLRMHAHETLATCEDKEEDIRPSSGFLSALSKTIPSFQSFRAIMGNPSDVVDTTQSADARGRENVKPNNIPDKEAEDAGKPGLEEQLVRSPELKALLSSSHPEVCIEVLKLRKEVEELKEKAQHQENEIERLKEKNQVKPQVSDWSFAQKDKAKILAEEAERLTLAYVPMLRELSQEVEELKKEVQISRRSADWARPKSTSFFKRSQGERSL